MPHLHRRRGATFEAPVPTDPGDPTAADREAELEAAEPEVEPVVVDEHGDDAAAVAGVAPVAVIVGEPGPELDVPARRRRRS